MRLITIYTPIAKDLRFLLMVARINAELERIGDQAVNNCEYVQTVSAAGPGPLSDITKMSDITRGMVRNALDAFDQEDIGKAQLVLECDDEVDQSVQPDLQRPAGGPVRTTPIGSAAA